MGTNKDIYADLVWRGLIKDISDDNKIKSFFNTKGAGIYIGFDPSFHSLHLGNYQTLCILKRLALAGFNSYALAGGITGLIGDPKPSVERQMQAKETINKNVIAITKQLIKYGNVKKVFNNIDFYAKMTIADYLRDIGKLINVNYILEKEIISRRLETGISYAEFSYTLLQGYDFLYLYDKYNIICQAGGSDQWGNITTGLEMIRKTHPNNANACCFSIQLLLKPDGTKFGKSESGAVYLDPTITSPYKMYQFLLNQEDSIVEPLLKRLTFLTQKEIVSILESHKKEPFKRLAQKALAKAVVCDIHGEAKYKEAFDISQKLFNNEIDKLSPEKVFDALSGTNNVVKCQSAKINILDALVATNVIKSKSEARKLIEQKTIYCNGELISDINFDLKKDGGKYKKFYYIKKGKRDYFLITW